MKKINWFARLFMSWTTLENYIKNNSNDDIEKNDLIKYKTQVAEKDKQIGVLSNSISNLEKDRDDKTINLIELKKIISNLEMKKDISLENEKEFSKDFAVQKEVIDNLKNLLSEKKNDMKHLETSIHDKLSPLDKIDKTFFGKAGNKGKGELGELQLKTILEKSGLDEGFWIENLMVGRSQVEFAIKSGKIDKWIPIDSKVLETKTDENNEIIIDDTYEKTVRQQAKEITKYLGKKNTSDYGLLVLQNDDIYMKLYEQSPFLFNDTIREYKVYISSPSGFIQFAWSISHILEIYEKINNDKKIYDLMMDTLLTINKLSNSLIKVHQNFNIAMNTYYPTLKSRGDSLVNKLVKNGKISEFKSLNDKK